MLMIYLPHYVSNSMTFVKSQGVIRASGFLLAWRSEVTESTMALMVCGMQRSSVVRSFRVAQMPWFT